MQGNFSVFTKNLRNFIPGTASFLSQAGRAFSTWSTYKNRQWAHAPQHVTEQKEVWEQTFLKRALCQHTNMWIDTNLSSEVTHKDIAHLIQFKQDFWKMLHASFGVVALGGYSLPGYAVWLGNDTWVPSHFNQTPEEVKNWHTAQDLIRYKWAAVYIHECFWPLEHHFVLPAKWHQGWDEVFENNSTRRDPLLCRDASALYEVALPFYTMRRRLGRLLGRSLGIPTFPLFAKLCVQTRIRDYWELILNEDYIILTQNVLPTFTDEELQQFAWRRYLSPYDKNLSRTQLEQRLQDYYTFVCGTTDYTNKNDKNNNFLHHGSFPNMFILNAYVLGYYHDAAYLEEDIVELDAKNDYESLRSWGKDAFMRRLDFENGPFKDQVEAHTRQASQISQ